MKVNKLITIVMPCLLSILMIAPLSHAATQPIYNVEHHAIAFASEQLTLKQIRARIITAATARGWQCQDAGKNCIICNLMVRQKHQAKIEIRYNQKGFSIQNISSINLNSKDGKIHRSYNRWIQKLENSIAKALNGV